MNRKNITSLIINKHLVIVRYLIVLLAIIAIVSLFPKTTKFKYSDYEVERPWKYENLYAPFDFSIKKMPDSLDAERKRIKRDFAPFYQRNDEVQYEVTERFLSNFNDFYAERKRDTAYTTQPSDSLRYTDLALLLIDTIYQKGIWEVEEKKKFNGLSKKRIRLLQSEQSAKSSRRRPDDFFTFSSASKLIKELVNVNVKVDTSISFLTEMLCQHLPPNVSYNAEKSKEYEDEELKSISLNKGDKIQEGEIIIAQGALVNPERYQVLWSLEQEYGSRNQQDNSHLGILSRYLTDIGYFILVGIALFVFVLFMRTFEKDTFNSIRKLSFILLSIVLFLYVVKMLINVKEASIPTISFYVLPFCTIPIIIKNFFGSRMALYTYLILILLAGFMVPTSYDFLFLHLLAGLVAIIVNVRTSYWSQFFITTAYIFLTYCIGYLGVSLIQEANLADINWGTYAWLGVNAFFTLLAYPLIPVFEKIFGFVSDITLVELGDMNRPLLKKLSKKAPGTFWHSLQVSSLAEAAAAEIGANALLAKVGALYHDIGKMQRPIYFIENQKTAINPHDDLPYKESARIIIEHVTYGIELAKKEGLPNIIIDFIRTHHGNTRTEYFYQKYLQANPDEEVDQSKFRYPGPIPYSKETAIVMMADSLEAASKSLKTPSEEDINNLVENIIDGKMKQHQFINCDLSFKDITAIKKVLKKQLKSLYHIRISYPEIGGHKTTQPAAMLTRELPKPKSKK